MRMWILICHLKLGIWKDTLVFHLLIPKRSLHIEQTMHCSNNNIGHSFVWNLLPNNNLGHLPCTDLSLVLLWSWFFFLAIYYPWLLPSLAFHVTFAYGASFKVFTIPMVISSDDNVLTDFRCFPGLLPKLLKWQIETFANIPLWLIWLQLHMVFDYRIRVNRRTELFTIHFDQNDRSSWESFLHHIRTLIWWCELSSCV